MTWFLCFFWKVSYQCERCSYVSISSYFLTAFSLFFQFFGFIMKYLLKIFSLFLLLEICWAFCILGLIPFSISGLELGFSFPFSVVFFSWKLLFLFFFFFFFFWYVFPLKCSFFHIRRFCTSEPPGKPCQC